MYNEAQDLSELNKIQSQIDDIQSDIDDIKDSMPDYVKDNERIRSERRRLGREKSSLIQEKRDAMGRKYSLQREINTRTREVLHDSPSIGECESRGYDKIIIRLPDGFDRKSYEENPLVKEGEYIFFPMAGSASETARQKFALDRIEGKNWVKDNPPVNKRLTNFLFNPRYAIST